MKWILICVVILIFGCTMVNMDQRPPEDWPKLEVKYRKIGMMEVQQKCGGIPFVWHVFMCMEPDFEKGECNLYHYYEPHELAHKATQWIIEHEMAHCAGYDHYGSTELRDLWEAWKNGKR